jgi:hypothetical protein
MPGMPGKEGQNATLTPLAARSARALCPDGGMKAGRDVLQRPCPLLVVAGALQHPRIRSGPGPVIFG